MAELIGERIQKIRQELGLSLSELAAKADVAKSYLSNVERNIQINPSISFIEKISHALNVSVGVLLYGDQPDQLLDPEWSSLLHEAMSSGVSKQEFKEFLEYQKWKRDQKN
ncbi:MULTISPECIES: helix-turn-helix domain-containing protein [Paenibacillus]|uniref:HTH-type transcriptional regulator SinR n=2 Tax=Paenibacillus TaxID=44249 RepID=A0A919Y3J7_9BACL|nr:MULTISPECIES: helix-turn-helix domain-containing protein [Paenibacillus]MBU5674607.1 helix-turn-helix domain-containing protein [Paenibacillus brevis]GIO43456.1 HTH-type transcriptional regulator SinR [Paenibacillus apis]